jgi:uncharacterized RDD family membrane protein YckC
LVNPIALNIVAAAVIVSPVTVGLAWLESRNHEATLGKWVGRLAVVTVVGRACISFVRALGRNAAKVMVPWLVGHAAVFSIVAASATGAIPISVSILTGLAYVLPIVSLFVGSGRTPYDRLASNRDTSALFLTRTLRVSAIGRAERARSSRQPKGCPEAER